MAVITRSLTRTREMTDQIDAVLAIASAHPCRFRHSMYLFAFHFKLQIQSFRAVRTACATACSGVFTNISPGYTILRECAPYYAY